jgi:hypothetical protein
LTEFIESLRQAKEAKEKFIEEERSAPSGIAAFFGRKKIKRAGVLGEFRFFDNFKASAAVDALIENDMEAEASQISEIMSLSKQIVKLLISQGRRVLEDGGRAMLLEYGPPLLLHGEQHDPAVTQVIVSSLLGSSSLCQRFSFKSCKRPSDTTFCEYSGRSPPFGNSLVILRFQL